MVVGRDYLLKKPNGPGPAKRFLDTRLTPRAVNTAGALEVLLHRAAARTGVRPSLLLASGATLGSMALFGLLVVRRIQVEPKVETPA